MDRLAQFDRLGFRENRPQCTLVPADQSPASPFQKPILQPNSGMGFRSMSVRFTPFANRPSRTVVEWTSTSVGFLGLRFARNYQWLSQGDASESNRKWRVASVAQLAKFAGRAPQ